MAQIVAATPYPDALFSFCKSMPKIELHAHIHGSLRLETLREFVQQHEDPHLAQDNPWLFDGLRNSVDTTILQEQAFVIFALIHKVVTTKERLTRIVLECIADFAADNVKYLELRSTPRLLDDTTIMREYLDTVLDAIQRASNQYPELQVRLIVSINRTHSVRQAQATLDLVRRYLNDNPPVIVGLDFSGNPAVKNTGFHHFESIFTQARNAGLKVTLHFAEGYDDRQDTDDILAFEPDRVGHACCLSLEQWTLLQQQKIPIEMCPTSNIVTRPELNSHCICCVRRENLQTTGTSSSSSVCPESCRMCACDSVDEMMYCRQMYDELDCVCGYTIHPLRPLLKIEAPGHPMCICTDDPGVFATSNSLEYYRLARACGLSPLELLTLAESAIAMIFDPNPSTIQALQHDFFTFRQALE